MSCDTDTPLWFSPGLPWPKTKAGEEHVPSEQRFDNRAVPAMQSSCHLSTMQPCGKGGIWSFSGPARRLLWSSELELALTEISLISQLLFWHNTSDSPVKCPKTHHKTFVLFPYHGFKLQWELAVGRRTWKADVSSWCIHQVMAWAYQIHPHWNQVWRNCLERLSHLLSAGNRQKHQLFFPLPVKSPEIPRWKCTSSATYFCLWSI